MSIIDQTYFREGELKLPIDNINDIQFFIDNHEKDILKNILGYALYKDFIEGLDEVTPNAKWTNLRDGDDYTDTSGNLQQYEGIQQISANYVFFNILADKQNYTTDSGVKSGITDNSEIADPKYKQTWAWNDMIDRKVFLDGYITAINNESPDTYENYTEKIITKTNIFNI